MPISKGEPWGAPGPLPPHGVVVRSDAEARAIVTAARRAGEPIPPLGLLGGDLCRTLGGTGDEGRLRSDAAVSLPVDLGAVLVDGRLHWFVAHLVARHGWWRGRVVAAMNAQFLGAWDVTPRGHPNDGRLDVLDADLPFDERLQVRTRLKHGTHLPHPRIEERHQAAVQLDFERPTPVLPRRPPPRGPRQVPVDPSRTRRPASASSERSLAADVGCERPAATSDGAADALAGTRSERLDRAGLDPRGVAWFVPVRHDRRSAGRGRRRGGAPGHERPQPHGPLAHARSARARTLPHVPGCDVAGVVEEVGADVDGWAVGDEVVVNPAVAPVDAIVALGDDAPLGRGFQILGEQRWGGHAERVVVPARNLVARPAGRSWDECAAYPLATLTAWRMLKRARLTAGERCLIVGIGGGVSTAALHLAARMGAEVHVTSRDGGKRAGALTLGAVAAYDSAEDWPVQAEVVVESVGPATWERSIRAVARGGRLVVCGGTSGQKVELDLPRLFFKQIEVIGSTMGGYGEFAEVTRLVEQGLPVSVDSALDLESYPAALGRLEAGAQLGKVVLRHR